MSKSDRDRRGRLHSDKKCPESQNGGCEYCHTGMWKRTARRAERRQKRPRIDEQSA